MSLIRKPKTDNARDRRLLLGEEEKILEHSTPEQCAFFTIAVETAMRRSEIAHLERTWIKGAVAYLPETKNGTARAVPLSTKALQAIKSLPIRIDGKLFELKPDTYTRGFTRACKKAGIDDLRIHDLWGLIHAIG